MTMYSKRQYQKSKCPFAKISDVLMLQACILTSESPRYCCNSVDMFRPLSITEFSRFMQVSMLALGCLAPSTYSFFQHRTYCSSHSTQRRHSSHQSQYIVIVLIVHYPVVSSSPFYFKAQKSNSHIVYVGLTAVLLQSCVNSVSIVSSLSSVSSVHSKQCSVAVHT